MEKHERERAWSELHDEYLRRRDDLLRWFLDERDKLRTVKPVSKLRAVKGRGSVDTPEHEGGAIQIG